MQTIQNSIIKLEEYIEKENFKGYDPYDTLLSPLPFRKLGKWLPVLTIQFQKRNPINIRPLLGITKAYNPKAMGLFLQAYSILYQKYPKQEYKKKMDFLFYWLKKNYSEGYSGYCWGYNFPWASPAKYLEPFIPSAVVTGFIVKGIYQYYMASGNPEAIKILKNIEPFILNNLPIKKDNTGICFSYTPIMKDCCYNASLLAAGSLARIYTLNKNKLLFPYIINAVKFVISRQKEDGRWNYSIDLRTGKERKQIDFHQGYILESIFEIKNILDIKDQKLEDALRKGADFYFKQQFLPEGRSKWRLPKEYPVDIHNQSQGVITFSKLMDYNKDYLPFSKTIANWTIKNMQASDGHFYYQNFKYYKNKIPYMRWSQAWMLLALTTLLYIKNKSGNEDTF